MNFPFQKVSCDTLVSAINNTLVRDGFYVKETRDISETCEYIVQVYNKMCKYHNKIVSKESDNYSDITRPQKKGDFNDPKNCYLMQLSQIPGISKTTAGSIYKHFPNMVSLCESIACDESGCVDLLADIMVDTSGRSRKLGKKLLYIVP